METCQMSFACFLPMVIFDRNLRDQETSWLGLAEKMSPGT